MPGRRVAWADIVSDDSGSEPDGAATWPIWGGGPRAEPAGDEGEAAPASEDEGRASDDEGSAGAATWPICGGGPRAEPAADADEAAPASEDEGSAGPSLVVEDAAAWAAEMQRMAERMRALAQAVPAELAPSSRDGVAATDLTGADVVQLEAGATRLRGLQAQASVLSAEVAEGEAEADEAERRSAEAASGAEQTAASVTEAAAAAEAAQAEGHRQAAAKLAAAAALPERAQARAADEAEAARRQAEERRRTLDALRKEAARRAQAATEASAAAARAVELRRGARALPSLLERRSASEACVGRLDEECSRLRGSAAQLRGELDSAQAQAGARSEALEARVAQLERDCRELQDGGGGGGTDATALAPPPAPLTNAAAELRAAQDSNRRLVEEVRDARARRVEADAAAEAARSSLAGSQLLRDEHRVALRKEVRDLEEKEAAAQREVAALQEQIDSFERRVQEQEETSRGMRDRNQQLDREITSAKLAIRDKEEALTVLTWRLNKTCMAHKQTLGANRFMSTRHSSGVGAVHRGGPLGAARHKPRAKRASGSGQHGSDDEVESTTAGGESVTDGL